MIYCGLYSIYFYDASMFNLKFIMKYLYLGMVVVWHCQPFQIAHVGEGSRDTSITYSF